MFWPVYAVFVSLVVLQAFYVVGDFGDRSQIEKAKAELAPALGQAQKITQVIESLGKDLIELANGRNVEASKIVADFNIRQNPGSVSPVPTNKGE